MTQIFAHNSFFRATPFPLITELLRWTVLEHEKRNILWYLLIFIQLEDLAKKDHKILLIMNTPSRNKTDAGCPIIYSLTKKMIGNKTIISGNNRTFVYLDI